MMKVFAEFETYPHGGVDVIVWKFVVHRKAIGILVDEVIPGAVESESF